VIPESGKESAQSLEKREPKVWVRVNPEAGKSEPVWKRVSRVLEKSEP
jgi:hypothetical protein